MFNEISNELSRWAIPFVLFIIPLIALWRGVPLYETFVEGAKDGFTTAVRIMPFLVAMMVAITIFRASGALDFVMQGCMPLLEMLGVDKALVPLAVMRPLSGTGAMGMAMEILNSAGPDSLVGRIASTVIGSTDTTFYILTVYFGAVGISKVRYALWVGLAGDIAAFFLSVYFCKLIFG